MQELCGYSASSAGEREVVLSDLHQLQEKEERSQEKNLERPQYHCIPRILTLSFSHNNLVNNYKNYSCFFLQ